MDDVHSCKVGKPVRFWIGDQHDVGGGDLGIKRRANSLPKYAPPLVAQEAERQSSKLEVVTSIVT